MNEEEYELQKSSVDGERGGKKLEEKEPRAERRARLAKQVLLVFHVTMAYVFLGATLTWPSPAISSLTQDNSTLLGTQIVLNSAEKDMTGSLIYLGTLFGAWMAGYVVSKVGRRRYMQLTAIPGIVGWVITGLAYNTSMMLFGRFILGVVGGCITIAGYALVVELPDKSIRGNMTVLPTLGIVIGNLYTVALGYYFPWHQLCFLAAIPAILYFVGFFFLPESPSFLVVKGLRQSAITVLRELRGEYANVEEEVRELELRNIQGSGGFRALLERDVIKRIAVVIMLFFLLQMSGNFVIMVYTARILHNAGVPMNPDAVTAMAGTLRVAGTLGAIYFLEKFGRRYCLIITHAINALCLIILGTYVYLVDNADEDDNTYQNLTWIPTVCVTLALFICDIGVHPVPYMVSSEYFRTNIRTLASSICISVGTLITFMTLQLYSPMQALLGQAGLYWCYGATSVFGVIFCFVAVIETRGKNLG